MKIMEKIRTKIAERLKEKFGVALGQEILEALKEKHIEQQIVMLLKEDRIQLLNQRDEPLFSAKDIQETVAHHLERG